jgi:hypothetical protein
VLKQEYVDEISQQPPYQQRKFQKLGVVEHSEHTGIPAGRGFICVGKGVERRGSGLSYVHTC